MGCIHGKSVRRSGALDPDGSTEAAGGPMSGRIHSLVLVADDLNEAIRRSPELFSLTRSYHDEVHSVLELLSDFKTCFDKAINKGALIKAAHRMFEEEDRKGKRASKKRKRRPASKRYAKTLAKLVEFKTAEDPFASVDSDKLRAACENLQAMMVELRKRKHDLDGRLASTKLWRKAWKAAYTAVVIATLAVSVALAAAVMPAAAVAGATAAATGLKAVEYWFDTMWDEKEKKLEEEKEAVQTMRRAALLEVQDLETVRAMAAKVSVGIGAVRNHVEFALQEGEPEEALKVAMGEIMSMMAEVEEGLVDLKLKVDACDADVNKVASEFLKTIK